MEHTRIALDMVVENREKDRAFDEYEYFDYLDLIEAISKDELSLNQKLVTVRYNGTNYDKYDLMNNNILTVKDFAELIGKDILSKNGN